MKAWAKSYGGSSTDEAYTIIQTSDGGYVFAGRSYSVNGQLAGNPPGKIKWIVRTDAFGNIIWNKTFGNNGTAVYSIIQTADGGFAAAGESQGTAPGDIGNFWVLKLDAGGNTEWEKTYGGSAQDLAYAIIQTTDGGYAVAGVSGSFDGDITDKPFIPAYEYDYWVVRLNAAGNIQWAKSYGGMRSDDAHDIIQTYDGGFAIAGQAYSTDYDITDHKGTGSNYWLVKTDAGGDIEWSKSYGGGAGSAGAYTVVQLPDSGYVMGGIANQNGGDITDNHGGGQFDYWVVRTGSAGAMQWAKSYGGTGTDYLYSLIVSRHGGFIMAGTSSSTDGDIQDHIGIVDFWIVSTDSAGNITWSKSYGGAQVDVATDIRETMDDGLIIAGISASSDGDVTDHIGGSDYWILKLHHRIETDPLPALQYCAGDSITVSTKQYGTFNPGNNFSIELSDINGSFLTPRTIAVFPDNNVDSVFKAMIPANLPGGAQYRIRVVSSSPEAEYFDNGQYFTIRSKPVLYNTYDNNAFLGNDTILCDGASLLLRVPEVPGYQYTWQDNSSDNEYAVTTAGTYFVKVFNQFGCTISDTIHAGYRALPDFVLGNDTSACTGQTVTLQPVLPAGDYLWNTGSTASTLQLNNAGLYWLQVSDGICSKRDSIEFVIKPFPVADLGSDTVLCSGQTLLLDAAYNNATYLWQDGSAQPQFTVDRTGNYSVKVTVDGCEVSDEVKIDYISKPVISLGNDTVMCFNESLLLDAAYPDATYAWNNGSSGAKLTVTGEGLYTVRVTNVCGSTIDFIRVRYENCLCTVSVPTAFTPNGDGRNDYFKPLSKCSLNDYRLKVFNRWGQVIFVSASAVKGWDGRLNNIVQDAGSYVWVLQYRDVTTGKIIMQRGSVFLMR